MAKKRTPRSQRVSSQFDYTLDYFRVNFRRRPDLYRSGRGEQGVLLVEPYKSEILPHWRFRTPAIAKASAASIYKMYLGYKKQRDFVGMDMARKYLQMGYTRARRYANHKSGRKYAPDTSRVLPLVEDPIKAASARYFYEKWRKVATDETYLLLKREHRKSAMRVTEAMQIARRSLK